MFEDTADAVSKVTPETGFNVVEIDDFSYPPDLNVVEHFDDKYQAEIYAQRHQVETGFVTYVYGPKEDRVDYSPDQPRAENGEFGEGGMDPAGDVDMGHEGSFHVNLGLLSKPDHYAQTKEEFKSAIEKSSAETRIYETKAAPFQTKLSEDERKAIHTYTVDGYVTINSVLRGDEKVDKYAAQTIKGLDSTIAKYAVPEEMTVYRGLSSKRDPLTTFKVGSVISDKGFISTSEKKGAAAGFANSGNLEHPTKGVVFQIKVPAGSHMAPVSHSFMGEREWLLPRGSKFKVTGTHQESINKKNRTVVEAELV